MNYESSLVDLGVCIGAECMKTHGMRLATRRGTGPCSIYIVCDECYEKRLTHDERTHMVEVRGVEWVRHLGLHKLHNGRFSDEWPEEEARAWLLHRAANFIEDGGLESEAQELIKNAAAHSDGWHTESGFRRLLTATLSWSPKEIDEAVAEVRRESTCPIIAGLCAEHGHVHGREAEELRRGIEQLIESNAGVHLSNWPEELQDLLDRVDARDSLALFEAQDKEIKEIGGEADPTERRLAELAGNAPAQTSEPLRVQHPIGCCVPVEPNTFLSPGGVEPEEWKTR